MLERTGMRKLVLIGGGGHCKSVIDIVKHLKLYDEIVITDPCIPIGKEILGIRIVGNDDALFDLKKIGFNEAFITVGSIKSTKLRQSLYNKAYDLGFVFPNIIAPSACISQSVRMEDGIFIGKGAIVNADVCIGKMAIINTGTIIEHECNVGKYSHIAVGSILCGGVSIGNHSLVGAGTTIIQGTSIGNYTIIGAGSTVLCDVEDNQIVKGLVK